MGNSAHTDIISRYPSKPHDTNKEKQSKENKTDYMLNKITNNYKIFGYTKEWNKEAQNYRGRKFTQNGLK